jgi:hypothetical protein
MLPMTHAEQINREIVAHIDRVERRAMTMPASADIIRLDREAAE